MTVVAVPDLKRIISDHLRGHAAVTAITNRVVAKPTDNTDAAWVKVTQIDADDLHESDYFVGWLFQFDCYAGEDGGWPEANDLGIAARKALKEMPRTSLSGAVVTSVGIVGDSEVADPDVDEPARARRVITALIHAHNA